MSPDAILAALAARQHGVVTIAQLCAAGLSHSAVSKRVARGRLHRVHRGVYALGHPAVSREGRWLAGVLAAGEDAALGQRSATALWELRRGWDACCDVIAPRPRVAAGAVRVRVCRRLDPRDVTVFRGIPVTTVARTLVDLSDEFAEPLDLANVIHEAAFRGRFSVAATRAAMARANGRHHLDVLEAALTAHAAGSAGFRSGLERTFFALVRSGGMPAPLVNVHVQAGRRSIEVDFHWPERRLCVETDGPGHLRPTVRLEDAARDRDLTAAGYSVVRYTEDEVEQRADWVLADLKSRV